MKLFSRLKEFFKKRQSFLLRIAELTGENENLRVRTIKQQDIIVHLEDELAQSRDTEKEFLKVPIDVGDPSPVEPEMRKEYVARVAGLHTDIFRPKLMQMISVAYKLLEDPDNPKLSDQALKGAIYAFREIIRWGDMMVNEQMANQRGDVLPDSEEE